MPKWKWKHYSTQEKARYGSDNEIEENPNYGHGQYYLLSKMDEDEFENWKDNRGWFFGDEDEEENLEEDNDSIFYEGNRARRKKNRDMPF